jgi:hypothetical protein
LGAKVTRNSQSISCFGKWDTLFTNLKYKQETAKIDSLIGLIARQQGVVEHINYKHFIEIKNLCKPLQEKDFNELTNEIVSLFSTKERK